MTTEIDLQNELDTIFNEMNNYSYFILTKSNCKYCKWAKETLDDYFYDYKTYNCDKYLQNENIKNWFLEFIEKKTQMKHKTFPMIFAKNENSNGNSNEIKFIGGYENLINYIAKL